VPVSRNPLLARAAVGVLLGSILALAASPRPGAAQAMLLGRVLDSEVGQGIAQAIVQIKRGPPDITTDTLGRFVVGGLPAGEAKLTIKALGYSTGEFTVQIPDTGVVDRSFPLDFTGAKLPPIAVEARAELLAPRYQQFEQRRRTGMGIYLRWDYLAEKGYGSVGDAVRVLPGVRLKCRQQVFECFVYMSRTPQCQPVWYVDGQQVQSFHENTAIRDIYGIEVYRGAGEVPGEYAGSNAACGVIVIWTKSRPFR
jgi:hypothetical protein